MKNTAEIDIQERILKLLETNPQQAMTLAVEQYTGLIWHVAERHLTDPEDIKECVNDTFMEFYISRDRFDSTKGNLASFLAAIARNLAVSRFRRNSVRRTQELDEEIPDDSGQFDNLDRKLDLEAAMAVLKPEDMDIIRMKYYGGMTIQEIADSLGLPYETVKKRHQRSLGKMRLALIAALVLLLALLLAACAYIVMHYFEIVPGYGIISKPNQPIYMLEEEVTVTNDVGKYVLREAFIVDGELVINGYAHFHSEDNSTWCPGNPNEAPQVAMLQIGEDTYVCLAGYYVEFPQDIKFVINTEGIVMPSDGEDVWNMTLDWAGVSFPLTFRLSGAKDFQGYDYWMGTYGGGLAIPRLEDGRLLVDVYALNRRDAITGQSDSGNEEAFGDEPSAGGEPVADGESVGKPLEEWSYPMDRSEIRLENLTAVAEDGRVLMGSARPSMDSHFTTWDFGEAPPGKYVLQASELLLVFPYDENMSIPINLETCEWEDVEHRIPGGSVQVTCCEYLDLEVGETIPSTGEVTEEGFSYWRVGLQYRMDEASLEELDQPQEMYFSGGCPAMENATSYFLGQRVIDSEDKEGYEEILIIIQDGSADIRRFELLPANEVVVPWKCDFRIPVTVESVP